MHRPSPVRRRAAVAALLGVAGLPVLASCSAHNSSYLRTDPMTGAVEKYIPVLRVTSVRGGAENVRLGNRHGVNLTNFVERDGYIELEVSFYSEARPDWTGQPGIIEHCNDERAQFSFDGTLVEREPTRPARSTSQITLNVQSRSTGHVFAFEGDEMLPWKSASTILVSYCDSIVSLDPEAVALIHRAVVPDAM